MSIPQAPSDYGRKRIVERPDGYYWQEGDATYGPFATLLEAEQDMQNHADTGYEEGESLQEAEAEIGISGWTDPETGRLAEDSQLHIRDE